MNAGIVGGSDKSNTEPAGRHLAIPPAAVRPSFLRYLTPCGYCSKPPTLSWCLLGGRLSSKLPPERLLCRLTAITKTALGFCFSGGWHRWNLRSWQSGGPAFFCHPSPPWAPIKAMSTARLTFLPCLSCFSARTVRNGCQTLNFFSCCLYLISESPCFFKSQLLKILCLNICQGLGIS